MLVDADRRMQLHHHIHGQQPQKPPDDRPHGAAAPAHGDGLGRLSAQRQPPRRHIAQRNRRDPHRLAVGGLANQHGAVEKSRLQAAAAPAFGKDNQRFARIQALLQALAFAQQGARTPRLGNKLGLADARHEAEQRPRAHIRRGDVEGRRGGAQQHDVQPGDMVGDEHARRPVMLLRAGDVQAYADAPARQPRRPQQHPLASGNAQAQGGAAQHRHHR